MHSFETSLTELLGRQYQRAVFGDRDAMLEVRADRAIHGDRGPVILEHARARLARVDHGLDGEDHALAQTRTVAGDAVVRHLRIFVQLGADAVSHKIAYYAE